MAVQLLGRGPRGRVRESIYRELDRGRREIDAAIANLESSGVLTVAGRTVKASDALVCLEHLDLIAV